MKEQQGYKRGPYKRKKKNTEEEDIVAMIIELRIIKERFLTKFEQGHYRSRIIEILQKEIDVLEKVRKRSRKFEEEITELKKKIENLEKERDEMMDIEIDIDIDSLIKEIDDEDSAINYKESEKEPTLQSAPEMVSERDNNPEQQELDNDLEQQEISINSFGIFRNGEN